MHDAETLSQESSWTVQRCTHGCLHIRLNHVTVTLRPDEFRRLVTLLGDAYVRLGVRDAVQEGAAH